MDRCQTCNFVIELPDNSTRGTRNCLLCKKYIYLWYFLHKVPSCRDIIASFLDKLLRMLVPLLSAEEAERPPWLLDMLHADLDL